MEIPKFQLRFVCGFLIKKKPNQKLKQKPTHHETANSSLVLQTAELYPLPSPCLPQPSSIYWFGRQNRFKAANNCNKANRQTKTSCRKATPEYTIFFLIRFWNFSARAHTFIPMQMMQYKEQHNPTPFRFFSTKYIVYFFSRSYLSP